MTQFLCGGHKGGLGGHRLACCESRGPANGSVSVVSDWDDGWLDPKSGGPGCDAADEESTRSEIQFRASSQLTSAAPAQHGACDIGPTLPMKTPCPDGNPSAGQ